jgi:hypothetical protein
MVHPDYAIAHVNFETWLIYNDRPAENHQLGFIVGPS